MAVIGMAMITPVAAVIVENSRHYGAALTNDLASGQFARAYADWTRVEAGTPSAATPLVRSQLQAVYRVSSAARQIEQYLEDPRVLRGSCRILKPCGEFAGAYVIWALRRAAASAGHFHSESDAQTFFGQLDAQIQAGCASGHLSCTARLPTELQSLERFSAGPFITYIRHWAWMTLASSGFYDLPIELSPMTSRSREMVTQIVPGVPASRSAADNQLSRFTANIWPYRLLSRLYRLLLPGLLVIALIGFVLPIVRPRWPHVALSVLSGAFAVGALSRFLFVKLLDTTQFP